MTISGINFSGAIAIEFGGTPATSFIVNSASSISAVSPARSGTVDVTVTTPEGSSPATAGTPIQLPDASPVRTGGYELVRSDGTVSPFGNAGSFGDLPTQHVTVRNITSILPTSDGSGYLLVGSDGGVFGFGDAIYAGSIPGLGIHVSNIVGATETR